eukprot:TRINITY_DN1772_c0_g1_i1.p1 TRINITY_DN1772_c0_g1~~TRINITY_DN1772_c0_g1_i1.p1  ORF type:complete len:266 (-),score=62.76 TRINITY_DN1772_c0_g1_i1:23-820(-)
MNCLENVTKNHERAEKYVREAAKNGADFVILPEFYSYMLKREQQIKNIEELSGDFYKKWSNLSKELKIWLCPGSFLEKSEKNEKKAYNTTLLFDRKGDLKAKYRKIHLFDVEVPNVVSYHESSLIERGENVVVADTEFGKVGFAICYDLRFPELFRNLTRLGAQIICMPSAFSMGTGKVHWKTLLGARAIENQVFFLGANMNGKCPNGFNTFGHSMIIDPWGTVVVEAGEEEDQIVYGNLDFSLQNSKRLELPCLNHISKIFYPN